MYFGRERSKCNLIPFSTSKYYAGSNHTDVGISYTVQDDGGIHIKGTIDGRSYSFFNFILKDAFNIKKGTYSLSFKHSNSESTNKLELVLKRADGTQKSYVSVNGKATNFIIEEGDTFERFAVLASGGEGATFDTVVYPVLNEGATALPYFVPRQVKPIVKIKSENLIPYPYNGGSHTLSGVTVTNNKDGSVVLNGTVGSSVAFEYYLVYGKLYLELGKTYTLSIITNHPRITSYLKTASGRNLIYVTNQTSTSRKITITEDMINADGTYRFRVNLYATPGQIFDNTLVKVMLNEGETAAPFKPSLILQKCTPVAIKQSTNFMKFPYARKTGIEGDININVDDEQQSISISGTASKRVVIVT